ncbi:MAG: hypothetical protein ABNH53_00385 [Henriciella sp.]|jgi:hypothetical protein
MSRSFLIPFGHLCYAFAAIAAVLLFVLNWEWILSITPWFAVADLHPKSDLIGIVATSFGGLGWIMNWVSQRLPNQDAIDEQRLSYERARASGLEDKLWTASFIELRDLKFKLIKSIPNLPPHLTKLDVFGLTNQKYGELSHSDYVLWRLGRCVAVAKVIGILERAHWEHASDADVYVGGNKRRIRSAIWSSNLTSLLDDAKSKPVHLVGVGLESYRRVLDQNDQEINFAEYRRISLEGALRDDHCSWQTNPNVRISSIDLGHANYRPAPFNYFGERDQRAVVVIAVSLDERVEDPLQLFDVLSILLNTARLRGIVFSRYSRSAEPIC